MNMGRINKGKYLPSAVYIVFDGTSHYGVYGCDIKDEIAENDVEVVKGPFRTWDENVDLKIEELNKETYGNNW